MKPIITSLSGMNLKLKVLTIAPFLHLKWMITQGLYLQSNASHLQLGEKGLNLWQIMRGIPRQAAHNNTPILGTELTARAIAHPSSICNWNTDAANVPSHGARFFKLVQN